MLQTQMYQERGADEDNGTPLTPSYFYEILKRRALYFIIPFLLVFGIGIIIAVEWPAKYVSQGTILVSSQEIPTDLVRPTVSTLANERISVIEQRIMTRDNLLELAKKYHLNADWRSRLAGTDFVDFIRRRTQIKIAERRLQDQQNQQKNAIAFTIGFEYERPDIAMKVANELVTMMLSEDVRSRTNFAAETTRFLAEDTKKLENQLTALSAKIAELKLQHNRILSDTSRINDTKELEVLRAQLLLKSATYSDSHPDIRDLKRKIEALEKRAASPNENTDPSKKGGPITDSNNQGLDTLLTQEASLKTQLTEATHKLAAARLGESLERGQHSERLEVIEQPSMPQEPVSPNRKKLFFFAFAFALLSGGGLVFAVEMLNQSIHRSSDLYSVIDSSLVVSIPYIATERELRQKKRKTFGALGVFLALLVAALIAFIFILPPIDVIVSKVMTLLLR
jgi:uncharacterized protein involved in exopolysaccharide biosynthesis